MKFNIFKTRRGKLERKLSLFLKNKSISKLEIDEILKFVDEYEKNNLDTIVKLKKDKRVDVNKINGALKQAINAHGPITKVLIGSASKRILGALLEPKTNETMIKRLIKWIKR